MKFLVISVIFTVNILINVKSLPFRKNVGYNPSIPTNEQLQFMERFGYIEGVQPGVAAQYSEKSIYEAVLNIQKFGAIEQTGIIDEETIKLMRKRRCGVKDIMHNNQRKKRYSIMSTGWRKREIAYFISSWSPDLGQESVAREIKRALDVWAPYGNITFIRTNKPSADIIVAFGVGNHGDPFPFDGPGNILAHAFFPYVTYGGGIHFDNDEFWTTSKLDDEDETTDFFSVAVHELGHSLGLAHSTVPNSLMFPYYKSHGSIVELDYDDVMAMYAIYIKPRYPNSNKPVNPNEPSKKPNDIPPTSTTLQSTLRTTSNSELPSTSTAYPTPTRQSMGSNYHGGYESEDNRKKHNAKHSLTAASDICDGNYDSVAVLRRELFVFKKNDVWRLKVRGKIEDHYPVKIQDLFPNLPSAIHKIDAAYERMDGSIALFSGPSYWVHHDDSAEGPFPLTDYGLPGDTDSIDSVFIWENNKLTYLFKRDQFWRFNESRKALDEGYPKNITRWRGIPNSIDAVITWTDGSTYFFKDSLYWRFHNTLIRADRHYPLPAPQYWFRCPENSDTFRQLPIEILSRGYMEH